MIFEFLKQQKRRRLRARQFPQEWLKLIQRHVVFFHKLTAGDRAELLGHMQVFLAEKRFEGCGGFSIELEVRETLKAGACLRFVGVVRTIFSQVPERLLYLIEHVVQVDEREVSGHWEVEIGGG